jgi:hypothetical protein
MTPDRRELAARPVGEKLRMLDALREQAEAIRRARSGQRDQNAGRESTDPT